MKLIEKTFSSLLFRLTLLTLIFSLGSCSSYKQFKYFSQDYEIPSKVLPSDFNQTWQAVLAVMKKYDIAVQNQAAGIIRTRWMENTREINFADSFGGSDSVKAARFKLVINVTKGFRSGKEVAKVSVFKRQHIEQDFLQGWKEIPTDGILEKSLLYRVERLVAIDRQIRKIEKAREAEQMKNF